MDIQNQKCSSSKHADINAVSFCPDCKKYFCNKCLNFHAEILEDHKTINLNQKNEIFINKCKEENHINKLEFYCKNHNILCCLGCISKIKVEGYGQHSDCEVTHIKEVKDEKKNKLKENIKSLEDFLKRSKKNKEDLKLKVQKVFTKIRTAFNEREENY